MVLMSTFPQYMRCVASGTYWPVITMDGSSPDRTAGIVDNWGARQQLQECESGRWRLSVADDRLPTEFVAA